MLFNSIEFGIFLLLVFLLYWFVFNRSLVSQNLFVLVVSYLFYGWWDWRFLTLIVLSSSVDFFVGKKLSRNSQQSSRKAWLMTSLMVNIGLLGVFKYYNFFVDSLVDSFSFLGFNLHVSTLNLILPVGISFYTFQTLSYTIDIYRGKLKPTDDWIEFFAYVSFFPQLVAGPIERAKHLMPQFQNHRVFNLEAASSGLKLILWGLFKKLVIADNCALYVNAVFGSHQEYNGISHCLAAVLFAFQIYGDFSGYSDIAIGTGRLLGFQLMKNFDIPYFSRDIAEFWRRWHISLSTWFRDYVYIPLGGSKGSMHSNFRNVFVIFLVSGLWHGANWTFVIWGGLNALYFIPLLILKVNRRHRDTIAQNSTLPTIGELSAVLFTFTLTCYAWIFFRSESLQQALEFTGALFTGQGKLLVPGMLITLLIGLLLAMEWFNRNSEEVFFKFPSRKVRWAQYYAFIIIILFTGRFGYNEFIYFQF